MTDGLTPRVLTRDLYDIICGKNEAPLFRCDSFVRRLWFRNRTLAHWGAPEKAPIHLRQTRQPSDIETKPLVGSYSIELVWKRLKLSVSETQNLKNGSGQKNFPLFSYTSEILHSFWAPLFTVCQKFRTTHWEQLVMWSCNWRGQKSGTMIQALQSSAKRFHNLFRSKSMRWREITPWDCLERWYCLALVSSSRLLQGVQI